MQDQLRFPLAALPPQPHDDSLLTASHSFRSSPSGSKTASRKFPDPSLSVPRSKRSSAFELPGRAGTRLVHGGRRRRTLLRHIWSTRAEYARQLRLDRATTGGPGALLQLVLFCALGDVLQREGQLGSSLAGWGGGWRTFFGLKVRFLVLRDGGMRVRSSLAVRGRREAGRSVHAKEGHGEQQAGERDKKGRKKESLGEAMVSRRGAQLALGR